MPLFEGDYVSVDRSRPWDVSPDGQRFVMVEGESEALPTEIQVVLTWFEELKQKSR